MPRKKLTPQQAKALLMADGMSFQEDFHALGSSAVQALADVAKLAGYRKSKNAPGSTVRMFYQYLSRVEPVVHVPGQLTSAERRAYQARARARQSHSTKKSPAQLQLEIDKSLAERYPYTMGKAGLWHHRAKETREQIARERAAAGMSPPYERFKIGDAVQFRSEPGTAGVIVRFESEPSEGRSWARVATSRGERRVPTDAIRRVRKEHEDRVRRSVETPSHSTIHAPKPSMTVRQINAIVRAADGRNVYLIRSRMGDETVQRITSARTKGRETEVRALATGNWIPVLPERGDKLEVR